MLFTYQKNQSDETVFLDFTEPATTTVITPGEVE